MFLIVWVCHHKNGLKHLLAVLFTDAVQFALRPGGYLRKLFCVTLHRLFPVVHSPVRCRRQFEFGNIVFGKNCPSGTPPLSAWAPVGSRFFFFVSRVEHLPFVRYSILLPSTVQIPRACAVSWFFPACPFGFRASPFVADASSRQLGMFFRCQFAVFLVFFNFANQLFFFSCSPSLGPPRMIRP